MEWLQENLMAPILATIMAWFWHDKRQRDSRMSQIESNVKAVEKRVEEQEGDSKVMAERLTGLNLLMDAKLDSIQRSLLRLEERS